MAPACGEVARDARGGLHFKRRSSRPDCDAGEGLFSNSDSSSPVASFPERFVVLNRAPDNLDAAHLLAQVRSGDREAAAEFAIRYAPLLRRRISGKLGPHLRRHFDSADILSTVLRRLDVYVEGNRLEASTEDEFWSLMLRIAQNAVVDKLRVIRRLDHVEGEDGAVARSLARRLRLAQQDSDDGSEIELSSAFDSLESDLDRRILWLWLNGTSHAQIAVILGLSADAARKRWERIRRHLRDAYDEDPQA